MSIATMNWALQQRLASPQQQILLYVIADSASPDGVTQHCDPDYLVRHSRLSRATVFRRLSELRDLGLLETFNKHGARGMRIYEIRLALASVVQLPLRGEHDDIGDDEGHETGPESQAETQGASQRETVAVSPVRPAQSHSCDSISPPLSKDSPPNPPPGGSVPVDDDQEPENFTAFFTGYPGHRVMDRARALQVFRAMTEAERDLACAAVPLYAAELKRLTRRPKDAYKWLRDRGFDLFPHAKLPEKAPEPVWIDDPDELAGLRVLWRIADLVPSRIVTRNDKPAVQRLAPVGADLRGLAVFDAVDVLDWLVVEEGSAEFNAWRHRLHDWTWRWIEPRVVMRHGTHKLQLLPGQPERDVQNRTKGIPVPCRWPPRKDGSIGERDGPRAADDSDDADAIGNEEVR